MALENAMSEGQEWPEAMCGSLLDLYRLTGEDGCVELGLDDALDAAICLVEWPDRLGGLTPARRLEISLSMAAGDDPAHDPGRWIEARAIGPGWDAALAALGA